MPKNPQKSGLRSHFADPPRILLQICYKRLKRGHKDFKPFSDQLDF